jgi:hypothetical protein
MERFVWLLVSILSTFAVPAMAQEFRAGAATSNITPEIGREIIGGFVPFPSKHIHDELYARCLVLDDGKQKLALVVCDLLGIDRLVSKKAREQIFERYELPIENVLISATHTHSASSAMGAERWKLEQEPDDYQRFVISRIVDGVGRALNQLEPAQIAFGQVDIPEHVFNRRWYMRPGTVPVNPFGTVDMVKMNPSSGSENLVEPAGPIDPQVSFFSIQSRAGSPLALYAAYSLHYVGGVGSADISADYYGVFSKEVQRRLESRSTEQPNAPESTSEQASVVAMMANGTSGDINNINFREPRPKKKPYEQIQYVGEDVAQRVVAALTGLKYEQKVSLAASYREPSLAWRRPTNEQLQWADETLAAGPKSPGDLSYIYAQRTKRLSEYPESTTVPLQVFRIGDVCIGTMPMEVFCEIGLEFKERSPIKPAFMVELAHGYFGYLPTPRHHKLGGYETWLGTNRVEAHASEKLLNELIGMAEEIR